VTTDDLTGLTLAAAATEIAAGALSPVELTAAYLERIERFDPDVNAYITVTAERALADARALTDELAAGRSRGPLHGIPIGLKDNIDTAGTPTTAASAVYAGRVPTEDAAVVRRLHHAGAVFLGKLNMHEFAYGGTSIITAAGAVHNPWDLGHTAGGSSGGSAAAVAAHLCAAALGTDTAASVRYPAACCGVAGLKATHGLASIRGIVPLSESHDHVGPLARTVADCALVMEAIAGYDRHDPVSLDALIPDLVSAIGNPVGAVRVGVPQDPFYDDLDPDVAAAVDAALAVLADLTAGLRPAELPPVDSFPALVAEAYEYHADLIADPAARARYDPITLSRVMWGADVPATTYIRAKRAIALARSTAGELFADVDVLVTPTAMRPALRIDASTDAAPDEPLLIRNTLPFNVYGLPTISIPCGFSRDGLPIGLQIAGPRLGEATVLAVAHAYEQATEWHLRHPPLADAA
jgi:aspartyl-tRNA(Asn)/glutamyl-tRNA(Gln) amidotransferase subunit A